MCASSTSQRLRKETGGIGNQRKNRNLTDHSTVKISKNNQKNTGDLRPLAVTQIPGKYHQLKFAWKTHKEWNNNNNNNNEKWETTYDGWNGTTKPRKN